jgi:hypothetical protein
MAVSPIRIMFVGFLFCGLGGRRKFCDKQQCDGHDLSFDLWDAAPRERSTPTRLIPSPLSLLISVGYLLLITIRVITISCGAIQHAFCR